LTPCSSESWYIAAREAIHSVGTSSAVQTWVTGALIDILFEVKKNENENNGKSETATIKQNA